MSTAVSEQATTYAPAPPTDSSVLAPRSHARRIVSLDIVRGAAMVLMAIDHVRVYSGQPPGGPTPGIFFTRWVTHFCAPTFIFLAGTGAYLYGQKLRATHMSPGPNASEGRDQLAVWLLTRGLWLVVLELTVLRFAWTFNFHYTQSGMAGVIWCIGWCMILLAGLIYLPMRAIVAVGIAIVAGHNIVDFYLDRLIPLLEASRWTWFWQFLYFGGVIHRGTMTFGVLYSIVPWVGVMALGYAFGPVMRMDAARRAHLCYAIGGAAIVAFLVLRGFDIYGNPQPWRLPPPAHTAAAQSGHTTPPAAGSAAPTRAGAPAGAPAGVRAPALLRFLGTTKYPASLLFLLMTLGPMLVVVPLLEHARGAVARMLAVFGRVPFFYYVLHIPLIHLVALGVSLIELGRVSPWLFTNHPMLNPPPPDGYTWGLTTLYLVWALVLIPLYFVCRWYAGVKSASKNPLLSYL
jgi:uncharacterized membrane protein